MAWREWLAGKLRLLAVWINPPKPLPHLMKFEMDPNLPPGTFRVRHPDGREDIFVSVDPGAKDDYIDSLEFAFRGNV